MNVDIYCVKNSQGKPSYWLAKDKDDALQQANDVSLIYDVKNGTCQPAVDAKEKLGPDAYRFKERGVRGHLYDYDATHDKWVVKVGHKKDSKYLVLVNGQEKRCTAIEDARILIDLMPTKEELDRLTDVSVSPTLEYGQAVKAKPFSSTFGTGKEATGTYLTKHPTEKGMHLILLDDDTTIKALTNDIQVIVSVEDYALDVVRKARVECPLDINVEEHIVLSLIDAGLLVEEM